MDNIFNIVLKDRYVPTDILGKGAFGITYLAWDTVENRKTAVKVLEGDFTEEARLLREGGHIPGLVKILDFFEENGQGFLVMEYLSGGTLNEYVRGKKQGKLNTEEVTALLKPVMEALVFMHSIGIVHCDVSPDNILLDESGECRLIDLGAARQCFGSGGAYSDDEKRLLKAAYAAPEQYEAPALIGPWTDVYALCAMMYELLTGEKTVPAVERIRKDTIKPLSFYEGVPARTEQLIMRGLEMEIQKRYFSPALLLTGFHISSDTVQSLDGAVRHYWGKLWLDISARGKKGFYAVTGKNRRKRIRKKILAGILTAGALCAGVWGFGYGWKASHQEEYFRWKLAKAVKENVQKEDTKLFTKFSEGYEECVEYLEKYGVPNEFLTSAASDYFSMDREAYMKWKHPANAYRKLYLKENIVKEALFYYTGAEEAQIKREHRVFSCNIRRVKAEHGQLESWGMEEDSYTLEFPELKDGADNLRISWDPFDKRVYSVECDTRNKERAAAILADFLPICCPEACLTETEAGELLERAAEEDAGQKIELNVKSKVYVRANSTEDGIRYFITIATDEGCLW